MGWGDKAFYLETPTWADLKFSTAFKAATGLGSTAIHTTYYRKIKENENCLKIMVSWFQYKRLVTYINGSFQNRNNANFIKINTNANYGETDAFYEATKRYSLFKTRNTWSNNTLKISVQKAYLWPPLSYSIFEKYE